MAEPYVNWSPAEVGPCTATWFVGTESGSEINDNPTFGPKTIVQPVGAWDFLVDGPLKNVLTAPYANTDAFLAAWAAAGGSVDFLASSATEQPVFSATAFGYSTGAGLNFLATTYDTSAYSALALPLRWVVKFSVPHSIIK